jgi:RimJ/RimL family protein N-acetyltransferase
VLKPNYPVRTPRLLLRPTTLADLDAMHGYKSQQEVCRYLPYAPMSRGQVAERLAGDWSRTELTEPGQELNLGVELVADGRLIGDVVLFWGSGPDRAGEIGYVFAPASGGRGYATEAARALLSLGFDAHGGLGLHRIFAHLDARNGASARVLERLGMRREGLLRQDSWFKGEWSDTLVYAMLAPEFESAFS